MSHLVVKSAIKVSYSNGEDRYVSSCGKCITANLNDIQLFNSSTDAQIIATKISLYPDVLYTKVVHVQLIINELRKRIK